MGMILQGPSATAVGAAGAAGDSPCDGEIVAFEDHVSAVCGSLASFLA